MYTSNIALEIRMLLSILVWFCCIFSSNSMQFWLKKTAHKDAGIKWQSRAAPLTTLG